MCIKKRGYGIKREIIKAMRKEIHETNEHIVSAWKDEGYSLSSKQFLRIAHSSYLLEDIEYLNKYSGNKKFRLRYADLIIRNMVEQTIEFIYLCQNPSKIVEFMGVETQTERSDQYEYTKEDVVKEYKNLFEKRFANGSKRLSVNKMAQEIGEADSKPDSLYGIYILLSTSCHNSAFLAMLDEVNSVEQGKDVEPAMSEEQAQFVLIVFNKFMTEYRKE